MLLPNVRVLNYPGILITWKLSWNIDNAHYIIYSLLYDLVYVWYMCWKAFSFLPNGIFNHLNGNSISICGSLVSSCLCLNIQTLMQILYTLCTHYHMRILDQTKGIVMFGVYNSSRSHRIGKLGHVGKTELEKIL